MSRNYNMDGNPSFDLKWLFIAIGIILIAAFGLHYLVPKVPSNKISSPPVSAESSKAVSSNKPVEAAESTNPKAGAPSVQTGDALSTQPSDLSFKTSQTDNKGLLSKPIISNSETYTDDTDAKKPILSEFEKTELLNQTYWTLLLAGTIFAFFLLSGTGLFFVLRHQHKLSNLEATELSKIRMKLETISTNKYDINDSITNSLTNEIWNAARQIVTKINGIATSSDASDSSRSNAVSGDTHARPNGASLYEIKAALEEKLSTLEKRISSQLPTEETISKAVTDGVSIPLKELSKQFTVIKEGIDTSSGKLNGEFKRQIADVNQQTQSQSAKLETILGSVKQSVERSSAQNATDLAIHIVLATVKRSESGEYGAVKTAFGDIASRLNDIKASGFLSKLENKLIDLLISDLHHAQNALSMNASQWRNALAKDGLVGTEFSWIFRKVRRNEYVWEDEIASMSAMVSPENDYWLGPMVTFIYLRLPKVCLDYLSNVVELQIGPHGLKEGGILTQDDRNRLNINYTKDIRLIRPKDESISFIDNQIYRIIRPAVSYLDEQNRQKFLCPPIVMMFKEDATAEIDIDASWFSSHAVRMETNFEESKSIESVLPSQTSAIKLEGTSLVRNNQAGSITTTAATDKEDLTSKDSLSDNSEQPAFKIEKMTQDNVQSNKVEEKQTEVPVQKPIQTTSPNQPERPESESKTTIVSPKRKINH